MSQIKEGVQKYVTCSRKSLIC